MVQAHSNLLARALGDLSSPADFRRIEATSEGPGWISFADLIADERTIDIWLDQSAARNQGRRDLAGSFTGLRLAGPAIDLAVSLYLVKGWGVPLPSAGIMLKQSETGATIGLSLRDPTIVVPDDDPAAGSDVIRVPDRAAVRNFVALQIKSALTPAFNLVSKKTPYKLRGLWGAAADVMAGTAARRSRLLGLDQETSWQAGSELIDALAEVEPWVRMRPRRFVAAWPGKGGTATVAVKGTCCLVFKTSNHTDDRQFCSNCPLLSDEHRAPRMQHILAQEHARMLGQA